MRRLEEGPQGCDDKDKCDFTFTAEDPGRATASERVVLVAGKTTEIALRLRRGGNLRGRVLRDDGSAASGAVVEVAREDHMQPMRVAVDPMAASTYLTLLPREPRRSAPRA